MKLILGCVDLPYPHINDDEVHRYAKTMAKAMGDNTPVETTGDVAEILEAKYHPMEVFWELHGQECADALTEGFNGLLETLVRGGPAPQADAMFLEGTDLIEAKYKTFLLTGEIESLGIPGVPTKAALKRRSLRFKKKVANAQHPSFVDTGLYEGSVKAEVEV